VLDVTLFAIELALGIAVPYLILRRDFSRLSPERLDRAWPTSSMWSALVAFGPLCLPFHFVKTRRSLVGLGLGLVWMVLAIVGISLVSAGLDQLFAGT
jgi:protein-S-isoprenylcysteine O-methyltransferase Ste14